MDYVGVLKPRTNGMRKSIGCFQTEAEAATLPETVNEIDDRSQRKASQTKNSAREIAP